jgi:uncharacterized membrane protein
VQCRRGISLVRLGLQCSKNSDRNGLPVVSAGFNINLFDFHPEVMALPALLAAILAARQSKTCLFCLSIIFILSCRDALSLSVVAMGFWLLVFDRRRLCGAIAIAAGIAWLFIATSVIIPYFAGRQHQ